MELLSPIKNLENASIAIKNGATALYLASPSFGARVNASIDKEEIKQIINLANSFNVKTYITFNIVIFEDELHLFFKQLDDIYLMGASGIILQDFAFIEIINKFYPDLEVHSSTQMHIHNISAVNIVKQLGSNRVVLPREMSFKRIKNIKDNINIDVEIFVHGALCVCYSGQCYDSTLLDQKSANRGRCSQYCRMPQYVIHKRKNNIVSSGHYPLNLKDLNNLNNLDNYKNANINSLKIEGRLKGIDYVGLTTQAYFNKLNNTNQEIDLQNVYNRTFTNGRISGINGEQLVNLNRPNNSGIQIGKVIKKEKNNNKSLGFYKYILSIHSNQAIIKGDNLRFILNKDEYGQEVEQFEKVNNNTFKIYSNENIDINYLVYKTKNMEIINRFKKDIQNLKPKREIIQGSAYISSNGFNYEFIKNSKTYSFELDYTLDYANTKGATIDDIQNILKKTKNTSYDLEFIISLEDNLFIPNKFLKELRDNIISEYKNIGSSSSTSKTSKYNKIIKSINRSEETLTIVQKKYYINCKTIDQIIYILDIDKSKNTNYELNILIDFNIAEKLINDSNLFEILKSNYKVFLTLPRIIYDDEEGEILNIINHFNNLCISEIGSLKYIENVTGEIITNFTFNTTNSVNLKKLEKLKVDKQILSIELNHQKINQIATQNTIVNIYGKIPVMIMDYCPINLNKTDTCGNCTRCRNNDYYIKDTLNREFPLVYEGNNRIGLYTKEALSLFDELNQIPHISNYFLNLTFENKQDIELIFKSINNSKNYIANSFEGNFYKETL